MNKSSRPHIASTKSSYITTIVRPDPSLNNPSSLRRPQLAHEIPQTFNLGTRKSHLALVQTDLVIAELRKVWPQHTYVIHAISTMGDKNQVTALHDFNAKALWTEELESLLEDEEVDAIVHCLKDIPTQLSPQFTLGAILPREDPRDVLILSPRLPSTTTLRTLPAGSIIGTSSVRRSAQLSRLHPHLKFQSVRGNINTRIAKLDAEDSVYAAIVLAAAGLLRINEGRRISAFLSSKDGDGSEDGEDGSNSEETSVDSTTLPEGKIASSQDSQQASQQPYSQQETPHKKWGVLYAVGQGALAIEMRTNDTKTAALFKPLHHEPTALACLAERSLMRTLEGGCSVPIGVETEWSEASASASNPSTSTSTSTAATSKSKSLTMRATVVSLSGTAAACAVYTAPVSSEEDSDEFGREVARRLIRDGADEILKDINLDRGILEGQADNA